MPLIVYPKTRFVLTIRQASGELSSAQLRRLERKAGVPKLENNLSRYLPQMPQLYLRGSSDKQVDGDSAYLISSTPIRKDNEWLLSPDECTPSNKFFRKLYASMIFASMSGMGHLQSDIHASELVLSFDKHWDSGRIESFDMTMKYPRVCMKSRWLGTELTFPPGGRTFILLGQLKYNRSTLSHILKSDEREIGFRTLQHWQFFGFLYRDTLRLLLEFAKCDWDVSEELDVRTSFKPLKITQND